MTTHNMSQEEFEIIEAYLNNKLAGNALVAFENRLNQEPNFKTKVEDVKTVLNGIETQALKEQLNIFHEEIDNKNDAKIIHQPKVRSINWKKLAIAAAFIIAAGSIWFTGGSSNQKLYTKYFTPDPGLPTTMSTTDNYEFYRAMVSYKLGDYNSALSEWETLHKAKPNNDTLNYFIGVTHLANKNETSAISFLEKATTNSEFPLLDDAHYYLALAYLKNDDSENAKKSLKKCNTPDAEALLKDLN